MDLPKVIAYIVAIAIPFLLIVNYELGVCWAGVDVTSAKFRKSSKKLRMLFSLKEPYLTDRRRYYLIKPNNYDLMAIFASSIMVCILLFMLILYSKALSIFPSNIEVYITYAYFIGALVFSLARTLLPKRVLPPFWLKRLRQKN